MDAEKIELNRGLKYKVSVDIILPKYQVQFKHVQHSTKGDDGNDYKS